MIYFTKAHGPYGAGEGATFPDADAQALLAAGVAALPGTPAADVAQQARLTRQGDTQPRRDVRSNASRAEIAAWLKGV